MHDLALDVDAQLGELLVVFGDAVVHVDEIGRDVAIGGVGVERGQLPGVARILVGSTGGSFSAAMNCSGPTSSSDALGGVGHQSLELFDLTRRDPTT